MSDDQKKRGPGDEEERKIIAPETSESLEEAAGDPSDPANIETVDEDSATTNDADVRASEEPSEDEPGVAEEEIAALAEELDAARRERDEYLDSLRRLKAEFENSRKRQERERTRIQESASERIILELLPILDNLDRALEHEGDIREGVRATRDQLSETLAREGLIPVDSDGEPFDPNLHEAVMSQPSEEHEEGTVIQTFQQGYVLNGRSIRAAKVVVSAQG